MSAALRFPSMAALEVEAVRRWGLREFVRLAWRHIDSTPFHHTWHIDAICEHLEAVFRGEIRELVINQPPGTGKSSLASVLGPTWGWIVDPTHRYLAASHTEQLVEKLARKMRTLIETAWFQERWPHVGFSRDRDASVAVKYYENTAGGSRQSITVPSASATGTTHADTHIVDDPNNPQDAGARSRIALDATIEWWHSVMSTRFRDVAKSRRVVVMQRLHEADLSAELIRHGATVLCLPMRFESKHPHRWAKDPRTQEGELLDPARYPEKDVVIMETVQLGIMQAPAQLQQRPAPAGGGVFKAEWFKRWTELPAGGTYTLSVDCTFKQTTDGSYVVVQCWYQCGPNFYLVDQHRERMDITRTMAAIVAMSARWPKAYEKLVEDKANGSAVVDMLRAHVSGLELVEPEGGKEARANAVQPLVSAGNVFLPSVDPPAKYPDGRAAQVWVDTDFLPEVTTFPKAANDDQVDAMTQFLNYAAPRNNSVELWRAALGA